MDFNAKFILFQSVIIIPFAAGIWFKKKAGSTENLTKRLISTNLIFIEPFIVLWSIWGLNLTGDLVYLPLAGIAMVLFGLLSGKILAPALKIEDKSQASFIISSSIANHGYTMGGFVCYLLLGEKGLGLSFIFLSYFIPYLFIVIFPYAKYSAGGEVDGASLLGDFIKSPRNMPLYAMILAIGLRLYGINRPAVFFPVDVLLMISIGMYYLALGMSFSISDFFAFNMESLALSFIRFLLIPFITVIVLVLINLDPAIEAIILIESFMPAAVYSVMSSVLFGLDHRRASTMFVFNTAAFLLFILPMLLIFYKHLHRFVS